MLKKDKKKINKSEHGCDTYRSGAEICVEKPCKNDGQTKTVTQTSQLPALQCHYCSSDDFRKGLTELPKKEMNFIKKIEYDRYFSQV